MAKYKLMLDAGHGGKDPGATSIFGREEDWALKITLYQYKRFKELEVSVGLTRDEDETLTEDQRVTLVQQGEYCYANHLNAGGGDRAEVIHSIHDDGKLANLIKEQLLAAGQNAVKVYCKTGSNGKDYYYMHRRTGATKVNIVEYSFIDNEADFNHFKDNWEAYAEGPVRAFCTHIGHPYKPVTAADGWVKENGKWYFYENGVKKTSWFKNRDQWYFCDQNGVAQFGWLKWSDKWYYLNPENESGRMMTGIVQVNGKLYYLNQDGTMAENERINISLNAGTDGVLAP
jgi:N-acetylmuramoyl-L-alanine amidase